MKKTPYSVQSLSIIMTLVLSSHSYADSIVKQVGFWTLYESSDGQTCYVGIDNSTPSNDGPIYGGNSGPSISFTLMKAKNRPERPLEMMIRYASGKNRSTGAVASISGANSINAVDIKGDRLNYWGSSIDLSTFIEQLKKGNSVSVKASGKGDSAKLSNGGFKEILAAMEARCNGGVSAMNTQFERAFFEGLGSINTGIDSTKAQNLRKFYYAAYEAFYHISNANNELQKILDSYKPFQDELNSNRAEKNDILNSKLPAAQTTLVQSQKQQVDSQAEIDRLQLIINNMIEKIKVSQKAYDDARAAIAPFEPRFNDITSRLSDAKTALWNAQSRLQFIDARTPVLNSTINQLSNELNQLNSNLPYKQNMMNTAYNAYTDASQRRQMFDPRREYNERLRFNRDYNQTLRDRDQTARDLQYSQNILNDAIRNRDLAQQASNVCHSGGKPLMTSLNQISTNVLMAFQMPEGNISAGGPGSGGPGRPDGNNGGNGPRPGPGNGGPGNGGPGHGGPGNPGGPGNGGPSNPPTPSPAPAPGPVQPTQPDCSREDSNLNNAIAQVNNQQSMVNQLGSRLRMIDDRAHQIEDFTRRQVDGEYQRLVDNERQTQYEYQNRYNDVTRDQNRISQISNYDLPSAQNELSQLTNERPQVLSNIDRSTNDVNAITSELAAFKQSCDWDNKVNQVNNTKSQLDRDQADLTSTQRDQNKSKARLQDGIDTEVRTKKTIENLNSRVVVLDDRAVVLNEKLSHLPEERAKFDVYIDQQKSIFASSKNDFKSNLN